MENRPRHWQGGPPKPAALPHAGDDTDEAIDPNALTPVPQDCDEALYNSMGRTRELGDDEQAALDKTHLPEDTDVQHPAGDGEEVIDQLGDFELLEQLGHGAMGEVWKAHHISFDRDVALKILFQHVAANEKLVKRLEREALAMNTLAHPNIVDAYGVYEARGYHFVAMEFVDGESLQTLLNRLRRLSVADALAITLDCARALDYAHRKNVIHRDIKPDNVLIRRDGAVKVADLGMVKIADDMDLTQTGHAVGTPWYMPLEQARNAKEIDCRCDIYALGCMLYCLLTGNPPFTGQTIVEVIQAKERGTYPPARAVNPEVPERLDLIIMKMTAKMPANRYRSCAEVIKDLESLGLAAPGFVLSKDKTAKATTVHSPAPGLSAEASTPREWYIRVLLDGETVVRKTTADQLKRMLMEGTIDPTVKASNHPREGFRTLATFKEFQGTALVKQSKKAVDQKTVKYRNLYRKIEEKDRKRELEEKKNDKAPAYYSTLWRPGILGGAGLSAAALLLYWLIRLFV